MEEEKKINYKKKSRTSDFLTLEDLSRFSVRARVLCWDENAQGTSAKPDVCQCVIRHESLGNQLFVSPLRSVGCSTKKFFCRTHRRFLTARAPNAYAPTRLTIHLSSLLDTFSFILESLNGEREQVSVFYRSILTNLHVSYVNFVF